MIYLRRVFLDKYHIFTIDRTKFNTTVRTIDPTEKKLKFILYWEKEATHNY